ncbi:MAG: 30S ribosomal protein S9 [Deltaproteobacteria bacterium]|jgi:small subunit ribosomal protein S9|nr:30S ribosomal protein S9 [Deltaproteobacteria bacterium]
MTQVKTPLVGKDKKKTEFIATGKRKTSISRIRLRPGAGTIKVNGKETKEYFTRPTLQMIVDRPFEVTGTGGKFDVLANVNGGGISSQAGAVRHGIARALISMNPDLRKPLKNDGLLTRDAREKERRKVGRRKARRRPQYSKR